MSGKRDNVRFNYGDIDPRCIYLKCKTVYEEGSSNASKTHASLIPTVDLDLRVDVEVQFQVVITAEVLTFAA